MKHILPTKPHLLLLDALRGVAAIIVLYYHLFECFGYEVAPGTGLYTQHFDHGYLAVDFFFLLSGFVIAYAYDERTTITPLQFARRRLIRLHPMVVAGAVVGVACYLIDGGTHWDGSPATPHHVALAFVMTLLMLPCLPGSPADVRGNGEMFPLNGPQWSLFFEYIGNLLYILLLRRLPTRALRVVVVVSGLILAWHVVHTGYLGEGWSFVDGGFVWGLLRMLFPYSLGMLMARRFVSRPRRSSQRSQSVFLLSSLLLVIMLGVPFVGSPAALWANGLYILLCLMVVFPLLIWHSALQGASALPDGSPMHRFCTFIGRLSYPLYIVHYPLMYIFYRYHGFPNVTCTMADVWPMAVATFVGSLLLATILLYVYDLPVRRWLSRL